MSRLKICFFAFFLLSLILLPGKVQAEESSGLLGGLTKVLPLIISNDQIGQLFADGLEKEYGLANTTNPEGFMRVQSIGQKLVSVVETKQVYDFAVLSSHQFNACSIYGGHIRVFNGLVSDTRNCDAELAAVIAHEIAHNELGHNKEAVKNFKIAYVLELTKISQKVPKLLLAGANAVLAKRSRDHEKAADAQALEWLKKAGYPTTGAIAVFRRIEAEHNLEQKRSGANALAQRFNQIFSTHPEPATRVDAAEDYLFTKKYGRTFKEVLGASTSRKLTVNATKLPKTGDCPIIVAHPSIWGQPLGDTNDVTGIGIFNPSPKSREEKDMTFYLDILKKGRFVCATCDNDYHGLEAGGTNQDYTFVCSPTLGQDQILQAIKDGRTYASKDGTEIQNENFSIGLDYHKVKTAILKFSLVFPKPDSSTYKVTVYRNGEELDKKLEPTIKGKQLTKAEYVFDDSAIKPGLYWYILYVPGKVVTSPITLEATDNPNDPMDYRNTSDWHKGVIHFHSNRSDGYSTLRTIWEKGQACGVEFICMTDHAEAFNSTNTYDSYVQDCHDLSDLGWPIPIMIPGVEYALAGEKNRHLLILGLENAITKQGMSEEEFFGVTSGVPDKVLIEQGPFHLGDDEIDSEIHRDKTFDYTPQNAILKLRVKGTPRKDPVLFINRQEVARIVTSDDKWHWYEFPIKADQLYQGQNLFHIQAVIPNRWQTFDDCEVADVYILKR